MKVYEVFQMRRNSSLPWAIAAGGVNEGTPER
jgi:hypothetical protein